MELTALLGLVTAYNILGKEPGTDSGKLDQGAKALAGILADVNTSRKTNVKFRTKDLIAQYPVLYSNNVSADTVQLLDKALEFEYVNLLKLLIQSAGTTDATETTSEYLSRYHSNIYNSKTFDPILNSVSNMSSKNEQLLTPVTEDLNYSILNEQTVTKEYVQFTEALRKTPKKDQKDKKPASKSSHTSSAQVNIENVDIKKLNALTPTNVSVDISVSNKDSIHQRKLSFGVKCVAHILDSSDIEYYLPNSIITKTPIMRMIQWTTGEISFFKDFLFAIDELKSTAIRGNNNETFWWRKLQDLASIAKMNPILKKVVTKGGKGYKDPIPVSTMVITKENVDNIKALHGIDILDKPHFVEKIMGNFFLMTFIVVDESIDVAYIFNDETRDFGTYAFSSLENATKQKNINLKDVYSLLK